MMLTDDDVDRLLPMMKTVGGIGTVMSRSPVIGRTPPPHRELRRLALKLIRSTV